MFNYLYRVPMKYVHGYFRWSARCYILKLKLSQYPAIVCIDCIKFCVCMNTVACRHLVEIITLKTYYLQTTFCFRKTLCLVRWQAVIIALLNIWLFCLGATYDWRQYHVGGSGITPKDMRSCICIGRLWHSVAQRSSPEDAAINTKQIYRSGLYVNLLQTEASNSLLAKTVLRHTPSRTACPKVMSLQPPCTNALQHNNICMTFRKLHQQNAYLLMILLWWNRIWTMQKYNKH